MNKVQIENCCLCKVPKHKAVLRLLLPKSDLKISLLCLSDFIVAFSNPVGSSQSGKNEMSFNFGASWDRSGGF